MCPHCGGSLFRERDYFGPNLLKCWNCSRTWVLVAGELKCTTRKPKEHYHVSKYEYEGRKTTSRLAKNNGG